jgi:predicted phosphoribosyltransferase
MPPAMLSIGSWYEEFPQKSDDEVRRLHEQAAAAPKGGAARA